MTRTDNNCIFLENEDITIIVITKNVVISDNEVIIKAMNLIKSEQ